MHYNAFTSYKHADLDDKNLTCLGPNGSYNRLKSYIQTAIDMDELPNINSHLNAKKKINWTNVFGIAIKRKMTGHAYISSAELC